MDFSFGDEEKALADSFRDFIRREVKPVEEQLRPLLVESDDPPELRPELLQIRRGSAELGFYSVDIPTEFGGGGLSYVGQALLRVVAGSSGSFLSIACLSGPEGPTGLIQGMKPALRERLVPAFLRAEISAAFALTEPGAGSDNQSMKTRAGKDGDDWVINGTKHFITNGQNADIVQLFAVTDPDKKAAGGVTCFIVEKGTPGFTVGKSQAVITGGEGPCELVFDDCRVPEENVIGDVGMGFYAAMQFLTGGRANIGAMCVGIGDYLLRTAGEYAKQRAPVGKPIGKMQGVAFQVADMALEVELARLATYKLAWLADAGRPLIQAGAFSKLYATEMVGRAADTAIQVHRGMGLTRELGLERIYRLVRILRGGEGTSEGERYLISKST